MVANRRLITLLVASIAFAGVGLIQPAPAAESATTSVRKAVRIASVPRRLPPPTPVRMVSRTDLVWGVGTCTYCRNFLLGVGFGF